MRSLFFFFLIALLCSGIYTKAQADSSLPAKIQGNWASPDCRHYSEALILTRYFYLKSGKNELSLLPAAAAGKGPDYDILSVSGQKKPARVEEDGVLIIGDGLSGKKAWDDLNLDVRMEYTGCTEMPTIVPKMMARFMRYADRIREQCTVSLKNDCARVLFKLADADNNRKITPSEIKRTTATAFLLAALADDASLTTKESDALAKKSASDAQDISDALMTALDKNNSSDLDYNEIVTDFKSPELPVIKQTLQSLGLFFPAFKMAAAGMK